MKITGSETINQLQSTGMRAILESVPEAFKDEMGFVEHSSLSCMKVFKDHPKYVDWCRQTMKGRECELADGVLRQVGQCIGDPPGRAPSKDDACVLRSYVKCHRHLLLPDQPADSSSRIRRGHGSRRGSRSSRPRESDPREIRRRQA